THYPAPVATTWAVSIAALPPLARAALQVAAWLAPEPVPRGLFSCDPSMLIEAAENAAVSAEESRAAAGSRPRRSAPEKRRVAAKSENGESAALPPALEIQAALGALAQYSLAEVERETLTVHRLVQAVEQDATPARERRDWLQRALRLLHTWVAA